MATVFHFFAGRFSAEIPAMMTPKYDTDKGILVVDIDWSSTGIWIRESNGRHANLPYDSLDLPPWLVARFEYWTWWYNRSAPWRSDARDRDPDNVLFGAYGFSLAVDLKRVVGDRFHVEYRKKEIVVPNPEKVEEVAGQTWQGSEPEDRRWMEYFPIPRPQEE